MTDLSAYQVAAPTKISRTVFNGLIDGIETAIDAISVGGGTFSDISVFVASDLGILPTNTAAANDTALAAAMTTFATMAASGETVTLFFPPSGDYYQFSESITPTFPMQIVGHFPNPYSQKGTWLEFTGCSGIVIAPTAIGSYVGHIGLRGDFTSDETGLYHGIDLTSKGTFERIVGVNFRGDVINVVANAELSGTNSNGSTFRDIIGSNARWTLNIFGADANACEIVNVCGFGNRRGTGRDASLLGNSWKGGDSTSCHGADTKDNYPTRAIYGDYAYAVALDQETWCSTNAPSGTTAHNQGWLYLGAAASWAASTNEWVSGTDYYFGAPFVCENVNATAHFDHVYVEGNQQFTVMTLPARWTPGQTGDQGIKDRYGEQYPTLAMTTNGPRMRGAQGLTLDGPVVTTAVRFPSATGIIYGGTSLEDPDWYLQQASETLYFKAPADGYVFRNDAGSSVATLSNAGTFNATGVYMVDGTQVVGAQGAAVADVTGGGTVDTEARAAINALLARCRAHGLIAT